MLSFVKSNRFGFQKLFVQGIVKMAFCRTVEEKL